jgi:hypothetical protein
MIVSPWATRGKLEITSLNSHFPFRNLSTGCWEKESGAKDSAVVFGNGMANLLLSGHLRSCFQSYLVRFEIQ